MNEQSTVDEAVETTCTSCQTVPVSHLQLEVDVPINGWQQLFDQLEIKPVVDPAGRLAIVLPAARRLFQYLRRRDELAAEDRARLFEKLKVGYPVAVGLPVVEGASPYESMIAAGGVTTPQQEFGGGRERPRFLQDELEAGQRADDEKRQLAAARKKERLADQMKKKLE